MKTKNLFVTYLISAGLVTTFGAGFILHEKMNPAEYQTTETNTEKVVEIQKTHSRTREYKNENGYTFSVSPNDVSCITYNENKDTYTSPYTLDTVISSHVEQVIERSHRKTDVCSMNAVVKDLTGKESHVSYEPQICRDSGRTETVVGYRINSHVIGVNVYNGTELTPNNGLSWFSFISEKEGIPQEYLPENAEHKMKSFMNNFVKFHNKERVIENPVNDTASITCQASRDFGLL